MAKPIPADMRQKMTCLLKHLKTCRTLTDVDESLLVCPDDATRPKIRLVGQTQRCGQLFMGPFSLADVVLGIPTLPVVGFLIFQAALSTTGLLAKLELDWLATLTGWGMVVLLVLLLVILILRYWVQQLAVSWRRGLFLDLDELSHLTPRWQVATPWKDLYTATKAGNRRLTVVWEDRTELWVWFASCCDRDLVLDIVRELIRLHHTDRRGQVNISAPDPAETSCPCPRN